MKKILITIVLSPLLLGLHAHAQPRADSLRQANIQTFYRQAMQYKNGSGVPMDYAQAVHYFGEAAQLGDAQSTYALAYMTYKGLGCAQDYEKAAGLFAQGAIGGKDNSMYFYGLCWRNGYGLAKNGDSARYWLARADSLGYQQAALELKSLMAENGNDTAKALVRQISNAAMPEKTPLNKFTKIIHGRPTPGMMAGRYSGWLVQYDWSGQNVASAKRLLLDLKEEGGRYTGTWVEGTDTANMNAILVSNSLIFTETRYKRKDHYSPDNAITYDFQDAVLNMAQANDSLFLAGSISMFSPQRGEPSKPLFVALSRKLNLDLTGATIMNVGPNPFTSTLNITFQLAKAAEVEVQLVALSGVVVYRNAAGSLQAGNYQLPLQPGFIAPGVYGVKLVYSGQSKVVKVVRE